MKAALSMRIVSTGPGDTPPYADAEGRDGLPLIWFVGVAQSLYQPMFRARGLAAYTSRCAV